METRPTSAIIDTGALRHNYLELRKRIPEGTKIMAVVKANAYGHGDIASARAFESMGCAHYGVAMAEEGIRLRDAGLKGSIVVLGGIYPGQIEEVFSRDLTPVIFDAETAKHLDSFAAGSGVRKKVHLKVDTGMGRLGVLPQDLSPFAEEIKKLRHIVVEGVLSHFSEAEEENKEFSRAQLRAFLDSVELLRGKGLSPEIVDMANSAAAVDFEESRLSLVRSGIMLYGAYPAERLRKTVSLRPAMSVKTRILQVKEVGPGTPVSYGRTFVTDRRSRIAVLPMGYADGIPRRLSNRGSVLVRGRRAPIRGTVCMDLTMCDVTGIEGASPGDEAVVIGSQGGASIAVEEVAAAAGTISYEILCGISSRVPRIYI